jgi:hypothetical protein
MFSLKMNLEQRMQPIWLFFQTWYFNNNYPLRRRHSAVLHTFSLSLLYHLSSEEENLSSTSI